MWCKKLSSWRCVYITDNTCNDTIRRSLEEEELEERQVVEAKAKETPLERLCKEREFILSEIKRILVRSLLMLL